MSGAGLLAGVATCLQFNCIADMADKDEEKTIAEDLVVTKYKMAGDIVNREF